MSVHLIRLTNQQLLNRSILVDKLDRSQGNFSNYAQIAKQKIYVPYENPSDTAVKGYIDLVPTDEVLLSASNGTIYGLSHAAPAPYITVSVVGSNLIKTPVITSATLALSKIIIAGTTFLSVNPDVTRVTVTNLLGISQVVTTFVSQSSTQIQIAYATVAGLGTPASGWTVKVFANSKFSNTGTVP